MSCLERLLGLDPCCGGINLLTGTAVIAGIEVISSLTATVTYILALSAMKTYQNENSFELESSFQLSLFLNFWSSNNKQDTTSINGIKNNLWLAFGLGLLFSIATLAVSLSLVYGVKRRNIKLVRGWLLFKALGISLGSIYLLTTILLAQATGIGILVDLTEIGVLFYCLWVVYAFMKELVEEQVLNMSPSIIQSQGKIEVSFAL